MYFQKSYEPKRETSKSKKCEILEDSLHGVTLSAPEKKNPNGPLKKTLLYIYTPSPHKRYTPKSINHIFFKVLLSYRSLDSPYTPAMITRPKYRLGVDKFKFW